LAAVAVASAVAAAAVSAAVDDADTHTSEQKFAAGTWIIPAAAHRIAHLRDGPDSSVKVIDEAAVNVLRIPVAEN